MIARTLNFTGCALLAAIVGCGPAAPGVPPGTEHRTRTARDGYEVTISTSRPIPLNRHFELEVAVAPAPGEIRVDADMPAHRHGMNTRPTVTALGGGRFRVEGLLFHMPGDWELYVDVVDGESTDRATLSIFLGSG